MGDNLLIFARLCSPSPAATTSSSPLCQNKCIDLSFSCITVYTYSFIHSFTWFNTKMRFVHMLYIYMHVSLRWRAGTARTRSDGHGRNQFKWKIRHEMDFSAFLDFYILRACTHFIHTHALSLALAWYTHTYTHTRRHSDAIHIHILAIYCSMQIKYLAPSNLLARLSRWTKLCF